MGQGDVLVSGELKGERDGTGSCMLYSGELKGGQEEWDREMY